MALLGITVLLLAACGPNEQDVKDIAAEAAAGAVNAYRAEVDAAQTVEQMLASLDVESRTDLFTTCRVETVQEVPLGGEIVLCANVLAVAELFEMPAAQEPDPAGETSGTEGGAEFVTLEDAEAACVYGVASYENGTFKCLESQNVCGAVPGTCGAEVVAQSALTVDSAPNCQATPNGTTDCACMEQWLDQQLMSQYGITDSGLLGTESYPLVYPASWLHDTCYAKSSGGTGAKFVQVQGPVALQMGEATGPFRMLLVPQGLIYTGWTQGGWFYTNDLAMHKQWMPEAQGSWQQLAADLNLGLICGYMWNNGEFAPAFRWNGTEEVRDESLDCPLPWPPSGTTTTTQASGNVQTVPQVGGIAGFDADTYPEIFKYELDGTYFCGARNVNAQYPAGYRHIETHPKWSSDGNYLHDGSSNGMGPNAFCGGSPSEHGAPAGTPWTTGMLETDGFHLASFPLSY